jgi:hypothetical protein
MPNITIYLSDEDYVEYLKQKEELAEILRQFLRKKLEK